MDDAAALHATGFGTPWSAESFAALLAAGAQGWVVGAPPVGLVLVRAAADEAEILTLVVRPDARRGGVARRLLAETCARLAAAGVRDLYLEVAEDNSAARGLYAACGFVENGRRPRYYGDRDALCLAKALS